LSNSARVSALAGLRRRAGGQAERELALSGMQTSSQTSQLASALRASGPARSAGGVILHQQQDVVVVAVVGDAADIEQRRRRPDDRLGLGAGRQLPG
jgi:hypothetical protein